MYDVDIQTSLSILGHLIFVEYLVDKNWAVEWRLNRGYYQDCPEEAVMNEGCDLLENMLRMYYSHEIEQRLISEFEQRQYEEENKVLSAADMEDDRVF